MSQVFLSHSSKDKDFARKLKSELEAQGVPIWMDEVELKIGESLLGSIGQAATQADYLIIVLSPDSVSSEWVQRELSIALSQELEDRKVRVKPVLYRDCEIPPFLLDKLRIDFRGIDIHSEAFKKQVNVLAYDLLERGSRNLSKLTHSSMHELMHLLLLLDQFPNGIWGASLESMGDLYGHKDDPGSISVTTFTAIAITGYTGSRNSEPIQDYRKYLQTRQSERGAFGMKRARGTSRYPSFEILEHARHTAMGLIFFLFYDGFRHRRVIDSLNYLLHTRTPQRRVWVDIGPATDDRSDPVTVAFVIDALERVRDAMEKEPRPRKADSRMLDELDDAIASGLNYIFDNPLRTPEGFWSYRYSSQEDKDRVMQNLYQYTTDVLPSISTSCTRLGIHVKEVEQTLKKLLRIASGYGGALPASPETNVPDLDATGRLILVTSVVRHK
jgi:hypothetical protein